MIDNIHIHIMPMMNPDGSVVAMPEDCTGSAGTTNHNQVDLDYNFRSKFHIEDHREIGHNTFPTLKLTWKLVWISVTNIGHLIGQV